MIVRRTLLISLLVLAVGCSSSNTVGSADLVNIDDEGNVDRIGAIDRPSETAAPQPVPDPTTSSAPTPEPAPEPVPTTVEPAGPQYDPVVVAITADGFDPVHQRVWVGTEVHFRNDDTVVRHVTGLDDGWDSGQLEPGATAVYTTTKAGEFNFQDETRVFYVVQVEVLVP